MIEYCCGFLFAAVEPSRVREQQYKVALIRKNSGWQEGMLNGIGGKIKEGETPVEAMEREFREETNRDVPAGSWGATVILTGDDWRVHFFRAYCLPRALPIRANCDEGRIEVHWVHRIRSLPTIPNLRWLVPMQFDNLAWPIEIRDLGGVEVAQPKDGNGKG